MSQLSLFGESATTQELATTRPVRSIPPKPVVSVAPNAIYAGFVQDREWLASQWESLHVWLLKRHLRMLICPLTNAAERADILTWLEAPLTPQTPVALSFEACVTVYDPRIDVVEFRQAVLKQYRQRLTRHIATVSPS